MYYNKCACLLIGKVLGTLHPNVPPKDQLQYDLQRVLGKDTNNTSSQALPLASHSSSKAEPSGYKDSGSRDGSISSG